MEILSFDLVGKFAHFRKYYSNSTALSFTIPPRTTLIGMLAAILGKEKDSYYEEFSSDKIRITLAVKSPLKKSFHRLNFLKIVAKSTENFRGINGRIQTPFEIVQPVDIRKESICFRIYVTCSEDGISTYNQLKKALLTKEKIFNTSLGIAPFSASIENVHFYTKEFITEILVENEFVIINSVVLSENVKELKFDKTENYKYNFVEEDLLPADFKANYDRELIKMNQVLFTTGDIPLHVKFTGKIYNIKTDNYDLNIHFLD